MKNYKPVDLNRIKSFSLKERKSKVTVKDFANTCSSNSSFKDFLTSLPNILAGKELRELVKDILRAHHRGKPVLWAMGAHVIKCGLSPIINRLIREKVVNAIALNGAGAIHDVEIALVGETSEDVEKTLAIGKFGMTYETAEFINNALKEGAKRGWGAGKAIGYKLLKTKTPYKKFSILANAAMHNIPATIHIAIGTDVVHMHPSTDGSTVGETSYKDFRIFSAIVCDLLDGGVFLNIGSAVILPEVFLKALSIAMNLGYNLIELTTANFDFIEHYRPMQNIVKRPAKLGARSYSFIGHHEILIPLLAQAIVEEIKSEG
jgi:hypothetical protein